MMFNLSYPPRVAEEPALRLIRSGPTGAPQFHFWQRGAAGMWQEATDILIEQHNRTVYGPETILALGPYIERAMDTTFDLMNSPEQTPSNLNLDQQDSYLNLLHRLPPDNLRETAWRLRSLYRAYRATKLLKHHFPARLSEINPGEPWYNTLYRFLNAVRDADWFPLCWDLIETSSHVMYELDEDEDGEGFLADFLEYIPMPIIGPAGDDLYHNDTRSIYGLLVDHHALQANELQPWLENCHLIDNHRIYHTLLDQAETLTQDLPVPLCFLPEVARIYNRDTGNLILDFGGSEESYTRQYWADGHFEWEKDYQALQQDWIEAKPVADQLRAFESWLEQGHRAEVVELLLKIGGYR